MQLRAPARPRNKRVAVRPSSVVALAAASLCATYLPTCSCNRRHAPFEVSNLGVSCSRTRSAAGRSTKGQ
eukprot:4322834-Pleurochrysis_carterae.AAC.1